MTQTRKQPAKKSAPAKKAAPKKAAPKKAAPRNRATVKTDPTVDDLYKAILTIPNGDKVNKADLPKNVSAAVAITALNSLMGAFLAHPIRSEEWKKGMREAVNGPVKELFGEKVINILFPGSFEEKEPQKPRVEIVECSFKDLPVHVLANFRNEIDKEFERRTETGKLKKRNQGEAGGESSTGSSNTDGMKKQPAMHSEFLGLDFNVSVLYGSLQRLNKTVKTAGGDTLEIPPSMQELSDKEKPENMLAAAKLLNHKLNLINQSLKEHLNNLDALI